MKTPLPEKCPFLQGLWQKVLTKKGWTARDLQRASGVSYNYVRHVVDGKVIPARNALRLMCEAAGLDFEFVWSYMHDEKLLGDTTESARELGRDIVRQAEGYALDSPEQHEKDGDYALPELLAIWKVLPIIAKYKLINAAWKLANIHDARVPEDELTLSKPR